MRNIFDQYTHPENRLTHSLASVLHQDRALLQSFLASFGPETHPPVRKLKVIEQGLPGRPELSESETFAKGLPDALIFTDTDEGWALIIESKVGDALTKDQLRRHRRTIEKYGFDAISGLAITVREPGFDIEGWRMITWKDVYSWGQRHRKGSPWAGFLVEYFNVAETRMANDEYLKEGTITEFSGISFDPYTYLEGKRVLRLLTGKLRDNKKFVEEMSLDADSGRPSITDQGHVWDCISFLPPDGEEIAFKDFPHCTVSIGPVDAEAMITFSARHAHVDAQTLARQLIRRVCGQAQGGQRRAISIAQGPESLSPDGPGHAAPLQDTKIGADDGRHRRVRFAGNLR